MIETLRKILYVDDNPKARRLLGSVLTSCGFEVITFGDPIEASMRAERLGFDLALLDYQMPRLSGAELAQRIKGSKPEVPVVLISGFSYLPAAELLFVDAHVGRGATLDELLETIRTLTSFPRPQLHIVPPAPPTLISPAA